MKYLIKLILITLGLFIFSLGSGFSLYLYSTSNCDGNCLQAYVALVIAAIISFGSIIIAQLILFAIQRAEIRGETKGIRDSISDISNVSLTEYRNAATVWVAFTDNRWESWDEQTKRLWAELAISAGIEEINHFVPEELRDEVQKYLDEAVAAFNNYRL